MKTRVIKDFGVVGKHVEFTIRELEQMSSLCNKVVEVIENHQKNGEKKIYLDDEDLFQMEAVLMCILETECEIDETAFDKYRKNMKNMRKEQNKGADVDVDKTNKDVRTPAQDNEEE